MDCQGCQREAKGIGLEYNCSVDFVLDSNRTAVL